jgi:hypothetical protein
MISYTCPSNLGQIMFKEGLTNEREINWMYNDLCNNSSIIINNYYANNCTEKSKSIEESINNTLFSTPSFTKNDFVENLKMRCDQNLLPDNTFKWIDKSNPRLYKWLVCILIIEHGMTPVRNLDFIDCYSSIVHFFDNTTFINQNKIETINYFKIKWDSTSHFTPKIKWLVETNKEQCEWAWDYLCKQNIPPLFLYSIYTTDVYGSVISSLDSWNIMPDSKTLFFSRMNKAWNQKKQRDKDDGKKQCSFNLKAQIKEKLDIIVENDKSNIATTLKRLIEKEYDKFQ